MKRESTESPISMTVNSFEALSSINKGRALISAILDTVSDSVFLFNAQGHLLLDSNETQTISGKTNINFGIHFSNSFQHFNHVNDNRTHTKIENLAVYDAVQGTSKDDFRAYLADGKTPATIYDMPVNRVLRGEIVKNMEMVFISKQGEKCFISINAIPIKDNTGKKLGAVVAVRDINEEHTALQPLYSIEEKVQHVFANSVTGIALANEKASWIYVNDAFCEMVGYSNIELLGLTFFNITHPDDITSSKKTLKLLETGKIDSCQLEKRYIHKNGTTVWVQLSISVIRKTNHSIDKFIIHIHNISESKKMLEKMVHSLERSRLLFNGQKNAIFYSDAKGRILEANDAMHKLFGYESQELIGRKMWVLYVSNMSHVALMKRVNKAGDLFKEKINLKHKNGSSFPVKLKGKSQYDSDGKLSGYLWTIKDLTKKYPKNPH